MNNIKIALIGILAGLFLFSCSSDDDINLPVPEEAKTPVTFTIEGFTAEVDDMLKSSSVKEAGIQQMYYFLHHKSGAEYSSFRRVDLSDDNIVIKDSLITGSYYVTFLASKGKIYEDFMAGSTQSYHNDFWYIFHPNLSEMFYTTFEITVGGQPLKKAVELERITGRVEIILEDAANAPANLKWISIGGGNVYPGRFDFATGITTEHGDYFSIGLGNFERDEVLQMNEANPISFVMLPTVSCGEPTNIHMYVTCYDENGHIYNNEIVVKRNLRVEKNKITRLRGKAFDKLQSPFPIEVNDEWDSDVIEIEF